MKALVLVRGEDAMVMFNKCSDGHRTVEREIHTDEQGKAFIWFNDRKVLVEKWDVGARATYITKRDGATMTFKSEKE